MAIEPPKWNETDATGIRLTSSVALKSPDRSAALPPAKGDRRPLAERIEAAEREANIAFASSQPHRRAIAGLAVDAGMGSDDPRLSTPLGRFCIIHKLRGECYQAGDQYAEVLRQAKAAMGFSVPYSPRADGAAMKLTDAELEAMRDAARLKDAKWRAILAAVHPRAPSVLEALCYDQREIVSGDEELAKRALFALATKALGLDLGINSDKA